MTTVLLVRHGRTAANAAGVLAGWTPGVDLDETGRAQAAALATRLADVPLVRVVASPLERCQQTAEALLTGRPGHQLSVDERVGECRYGDWTGQPLKALAKKRLWKAVQAHPSSVTFPGAEGESMLAMANRAVSAVREHDAAVREQHGESAVWALVSHGDVIKAVLADALGLHLDQFQRIVIDPCSVSVLRYTELRPFVLRVNDTGGALRELVAPRRARRRGATSDAVVGGGPGPT